ncbi:AVN_collapsed_G0000830.mRNA.1.CDS.1 [Saccharomyces cerevisiae]|nr:AVN_collapsed_G0000830.mRNA.1.CDS.1 [Saccharomyces cerevisiae]
MAGEVVSEHTPDSQEVTVTSVVCCFDSVVEIGHHVVYSVVTSLIVAVLVDTMAGEAVLEHMSDSQEEIVTTVVCFVVSVVCLCPLVALLSP